jgi:hypothetical protein
MLIALERRAQNARFSLYWLTDLKAPMNEVITLVVVKLKPDNTPAFQF